MNVLIVGLGSIAKKHIAALKKIEPNVVITALRREDSLPFVDDDTIVCISDLKNVGEVDFAIVSNPTAKHAETITDLISLNVPIFIEKPLFNNLNHSLLLSDISQKKIATYIACNLRFLDSLLFVRDYMASKVINEVNVYCGSYLPSWRPEVDYKESYSAKKELGGGVHIDLIHEIDYVVWLFGFPNKVKKQFESKSSLGIDAYDYANYLLSYPNFTASIVLNYYRLNAKRSLEVICDDGECYVDLLSNEVYWNGEKIFSSDQRVVDTYDRQIQYFIQHVVSSKNQVYHNEIAEAYEILKICLED